MRTTRPAPLYVKINGTKVLFNGGAAATAFPLWKQWNIDLASVGVNLKSVKTLTIGVGDGKSGGSGTLFIDDILLYATAPQAVPGRSGHQWPGAAVRDGRQHPGHLGQEQQRHRLAATRPTERDPTATARP